MLNTLLVKASSALAAALIVVGAASIHAAEIAHYTFDNTFNDSSPSMNHLSVASGTPGYTSAAGEFAFGSAGLDVDGTNNEWLALNNPVTFTGTDAWTMSFWARQRPGADVRAGMIAGDTANNNNFVWVTGNFDGFRVRSDTGNTKDFTGLKDNLLHHYALVADGASNMDLYIDGVYSETLGGDTSFDLANIAHAYTGSIHNLDGNIDEFFLFDEALDETQVANLFEFNNINGAAAVPEPATWLIWSLMGLAVSAIVCFRRGLGKETA